MKQSNQGSVLGQQTNSLSSQQSLSQSQANANARQALTTAPKIPEGLTPAWFTAHELLALQRICRDGDDERGAKILADAVKRADRS